MDIQGILYISGRPTPLNNSLYFYLNFFLGLFFLLFLIKKRYTIEFFINDII